MPAQVPPSGEQIELVSGTRRATIVEVGAGVRTFSDGGRDVLDPYPVEAMCDGAHGATLVPWPNRLGDGRYSAGGKDFQLALTEPEQHNAIHGLLRWRPWQAVERSASRVVQATRLYPMKGYPFTLDVRVDYALGGEGLVVTTTATNIGEGTAPYGTGHHPYLSPGSGLVDDCDLEIPAATRILTDSRQLPSGTEAVEGTDYDFRTPRRVGGLEIDYAFRDLEHHDGRAEVRLTGPDGRTAALWVDETYQLVEVFTGDTLAPDRRRHGLGVEPMTCPPNAFATGEDVVRLEPGQTMTTTWGVRLT
jgi:aldose 1-epimerase